VGLHRPLGGTGFAWGLGCWLACMMRASRRGHRVERCEATMMQPMAKWLLRLHGLRCALSEAISGSAEADAEGSQPVPREG
jgi:hypothetical protein